MDFKVKLLKTRAKRAEKILAFYIIFHLNRRMGTGEGRGGAPLGFYLKFLPPGGVGGYPHPPWGFI